ncbi:unnamed protein product [Toxocara canis]|uniref:Ketoacyl_synth_N domain-containing protein n=1 Tax=Toxocara canis TaxID=6265 RepID=A0A183UCY3_TOXCA|nr:unnamed protein product [Toxocara canis]
MAPEQCFGTEMFSMKFEGVRPRAYCGHYMMPSLDAASLDHTALPFLATFEGYSTGDFDGSRDARHGEWYTVVAERSSCPRTSCVVAVCACESDVVSAGGRLDWVPLVPLVLCVPDSAS